MLLKTYFLHRLGFHRPFTHLPFLETALFKNKNGWLNLTHSLWHTAHRVLPQINLGKKIPANVKGLIKKLCAKFFIAIYRHQSIEIQRVKSTHMFAQFFSLASLLLFVYESSITYILYIYNI